MGKETYSPKQPADLDMPIWRYLDFTKFVDLLDTKTLFFCRADRFEDRFEGSYPEQNLALRTTLMTSRGASELVAQGTARLISYRAADEASA